MDHDMGGKICEASATNGCSVRVNIKLKPKDYKMRTMQVQVVFNNDRDKARFLDATRKCQIYAVDKILYSSAYSYVILQKSVYADGRMIYHAEANHNFNGKFGPKISIENALKIVTGLDDIETYLPKYREVTQSDIGKIVRWDNRQYEFIAIRRDGTEMPYGILYYDMLTICCAPLSALTFYYKDN